MCYRSRLATNGRPQIQSHCLVKRSWALRGRNLARDSQADGASKAPAPLPNRNGVLSFPLGTPELCLKKSWGLGQSPKCYPHILLKSPKKRTGATFRGGNRRQANRLLRGRSPFCVGTVLGLFVDAVASVHSGAFGQATFQCSGSAQCRDASTADRHQRQLYQCPKCV